MQIEQYIDLPPKKKPSIDASITFALMVSAIMKFEIDDSKKIDILIKLTQFYDFGYLNSRKFGSHILDKIKESLNK